MNPDTHSVPADDGLTEIASLIGDLKVSLDRLVVLDSSRANLAEKHAAVFPLITASSRALAWLKEHAEHVAA